MLERVSDGVRLAELDDGYTDLDADRLASPMSAPEGALTTLVLTMDHPMHHATRGWVHAGELAAGDRLTGDEVGETFRVVSADFTAARTLGAAPSLTYNLTVADTHTYFVGEDGVLVHNGKQDIKEFKDAFRTACRMAGVSPDRRLQRRVHDYITRQYDPDIKFKDLVDEIYWFIRS